MTRKEAIADLIVKVEAGTPTRTQVESMLIAALELTDETIQTAIEAGAAYGGSLDAAKALHEAVLPGWFAGVVSCGTTEEDDRPTAMVCPNTEVVADKDTYFAPADSMARAWLIAVLKALHAQQGG